MLLAPEYPVDCFRQILKEFQGILLLTKLMRILPNKTRCLFLVNFSNLILTRTMSKSYSLAGLRVGYALASPELVSILDQVREVYNVDRLAQAAALAGLSDRTYFEQTRNSILKEREKFSLLLCEWGWKTCPSGANFLFTMPIDSKGRTGPVVATDLYDYLSSKNAVDTSIFPSMNLPLLTSESVLAMHRI